MVDTPALGAGGCEVVQVRVLLPAPRASGKCQERTSKPAAEMSLARDLVVKRSTGPTVEVSKLSELNEELWALYLAIYRGTARFINNK